MTREAARTVTPIIGVGSVNEALKFYGNKLGFTRVIGVLGEDGTLNMATMALDGARMIFARPRAETDGTSPSASKRPVEIYLEVADVEAYHAKLEAEKVEIADPLTVQWWGDKTFKVTDPNGYDIWFYQKIGAPKPPQGLKLV